MLDVIFALENELGDLRPGSQDDQTGPRTAANECGRLLAHLSPEATARVLTDSAIEVP
jgi:hypothetical protein